MNLAEQAFEHWQYDEERETQAQIVRCRDYYEGDQDVYLTPRLREFLSLDPHSDGDDFCLNVVRGVIEAITEKLIVTGFITSDSAAQQLIGQWWKSNGMATRQNDTHEAALVDRESFIIIDWDVATNAPVFIQHDRYTDATVEGDGQGCKAIYTNDDLAQPMLHVSKRWVENMGGGRARQRCTLYYPDRIEKWVIAGTGAWMPIDAETMALEGDTAWPIPWVDSAGHPIGIPVVHFINAGYRSEIQDALSLQDAINKTLLDLLGTADLTAFRIYKAFGFYPTTDGKPPESDGSNALSIAPGMIVGSSKSGSEASFDAIDGAPLDPLVNLLQQLVYYQAIVTRTPMSRYQFSGQVVAEGTLKQQDQSLLAKVALRQSLFGGAWERVVSMARHLYNVFGGGALDETQEINIIWQNPNPRDELQVLQGLQIKKDALQVPLAMLWQEAGYSAEQIEMMLQAREAELEMAARVAAVNLGAPVEDISTVTQ
jgi:hypothetical protein